MLTGDAKAVAHAVAEGLGIDTVFAEVLPEDKVDKINELKAQGKRVAMVGDGVNDAPALAAADLGVAMGTAGSDTAVEVADVAIMGDDPRKVAGLIGLARWTKSVVRQNIGFSLGTKAMAGAILAESTLSFLGLGISPPAPSWGNMLANAQDLVFSAPWAAVWPGLAIMVTVAGCTLVADGLRGRRRDG